MIETWGQAPDGASVQRVMIRHGDLTARFLSFGATLQDLRFAGVGHSLVLGYPSLAPYLTNPNYFGATVGRYANRINQGRAVVDGQHLTLDRNDAGKHHLHGGPAGSSFRNWRIAAHSDQHVVFKDTLPDGHMGYPGNLTVAVRFEIENTGLQTTITAQTDAPTLCNFTTHSYFNLDGQPDIRHHVLQINSDRYVPVDCEGIPTGGMAGVAGTPCDFRAPKLLSNNGACTELDHNFCVADQPINARLSSTRSSIAINLSTSEPGLQAYSGAGIQCDHHRPFAGIALEPQKWPDSPNQDGFPSALLMPGQSYAQNTRLTVTDAREMNASIKQPP